MRFVFSPDSSNSFVIPQRSGEICFSTTTTVRVPHPPLLPNLSPPPYTPGLQPPGQALPAPRKHPLCHHGSTVPDYPLADYLRDLRAIRNTGSATSETSFYPPLSNLLNAAGDSLKPKVLFSTQLRDDGAGQPDGGLFPKAEATPAVLPAPSPRSNSPNAEPSRSSPPPPPSTNSPVPPRPAATSSATTLFSSPTTASSACSSWMATHP